jgi:hypothetical protein
MQSYPVKNSVSDREKQEKKPVKNIFGFLRGFIFLI